MKYDVFSGWPGKTQIRVPRQIQSESPFETWPFEGWCFPAVFGQEGTPDREPWPQLVYIFIHEPWRTSKGKLPLLLLSQNMMRRKEKCFHKLVQIRRRSSFWKSAKKLDFIGPMSFHTDKISIYWFTRGNNYVFWTSCARQKVFDSISKQTFMCSSSYAVRHHCLPH